MDRKSATCGRDALRAWVGEANFQPPVLEMEAMVHLFFADSGSQEQMLESLRVVHQQAVDALVELCDIAVDFVEERDQFPQRRATNAVTMELYVRINETICDWTVWAGAETASWPPVRRQRRAVAAGPHERGRELFADIAARRPRP